MSFEVPSEGHLHWTDAEYNDSRRDVLKTIIILSVVTVFEVGVAIGYDQIYGAEGKGKWIINLIMAICSIIKVYYIMGTFMHLKHEKKWFILTVFGPFLFLIWAIIAFAADGDSWHAMRGLLNAF